MTVTFVEFEFMQKNRVIHHVKCFAEVQLKYTNIFSIVDWLIKYLLLMIAGWTDKTGVYRNQTGS